MTDPRQVDTFLARWGRHLEPWQLDVARRVLLADPHDAVRLSVSYGGRRGGKSLPRELALAYLEAQRIGRRRMRRRLILAGLRRHPVVRVGLAVVAAVVVGGLLAVLVQGASW